MASEYLKWKYRDVQPDAPVERTKKQRRRNWWHYHKWHVGIGVIAVLIAGNLVWHAATQVHPDYQIAYVGAYPLPEEEAAAWESRLSALGADCNGDGKVVVRLQYPSGGSGDDLMYAAASNVKLVADPDSYESYFFLLEEPGNELVLQDNKDALSVTDMYLASWTIGEGAPYVNEDGEEVVLYPARLDVLVYGRKDAEAAQQAVADWTARQAETYDVAASQKQTCSGQDYTVSAYTCKSETNPYSRGVSAFGVYKDYAISAELNCLDSFTEDEAAILTDFLDGCHYAA